MALVPSGFRAEILYQCEEEVLGTVFYFKQQSNTNLLQGCERLAEGLATRFANVLEAFGSNVLIHGIKVSGIGSGPKWSYRKILRLQGTAETACEDELCHIRVNLISELIEDTVRRNRNQIAGIPDGDLTSGRVSNDVTTIWLNELEQWAQGAVIDQGFQFFLAVRLEANNNTFFADTASSRISPFAGTRIDRRKNKPNTGRKKRPDNNGPQPPEETTIAEVAS